MTNLDGYPKPSLAERQRIGLATIAGDSAEAAAARRDYYALTIENCIAKNLAKIPLPLTEEQRVTINTLLNHNPQEML